MDVKLSGFAWKHFIEVVENVANIGGWCINVSEQSVEWSERTCAIHELLPGGPVSLEADIGFYLPQYVSMVQETIERASADGKPFQFTAQIKTAKGQVRWVESHGKPVFLDSDAPDLIVGTFENITDDVDTLTASNNQRDFLETVVDTILEALIVINSLGIVRSFNRSAERMFGYTASEVIGQNVSMIMPRPDSELHARYIEQYQQTGTAKIIGVGREVSGQKKDGSTFPVFLSVAEVQLEGEPHYLGTLRDLSAEKENAERIEWLSYYDATTGLPSRSFMLSHLRKIPSDESVAVSVINIDFFKRIHLAYGHSTSDKILCVVAERLQQICSGRDFVCRDMADHFWVVMQGADKLDAQVVEKKLELISQSLEQPINIDGFDHYVTVSIGASISKPTNAPLDLLPRAEVALHDSRLRGRGLIVVHQSGQFQSDILKNYKTERALREALSNDELEFHLQPKYDRELKLISAELLVRWRQVDGRYLPPDEFIPIAEDVGLIHLLGRRALEHAARMLCELERRGQDVSLAVNVSPSQFLKESFSESLIKIFRNQNANMNRLILEVTESLLNAELDELRSTADALASAGVRLSIDDFGTGYSNLRRIQELPMSELKIDKSFVFECMGKRGCSLVDAMVRIANSMDLRIVAEGVESLEVAEKLKGLGVDAFQGFYFGKPMPFREFVELPPAWEPRKNQ